VLILEPILYNIFINNPGGKTEWILRKFVDDTKQGRVIDSLNRDSTHMDLDKHEE